jgi:ankyrin repeat protein
LLNSTPSLTPAEQADVDRYIKEDGRNAILQYLMYRRANDTDEIALKYVKYFVSQGADVNAKDDMGRTPLGLARGRTDIIKYLASVGAK